MHHRRSLLLLMVAVLLLSAGCGSSEKKPSEKELATKRWAAARSGVMVNLAKDQYRNGAFDQARKSIDEALRLSPENPGAHLVLARLLIEKGELEAAEHQLAETRRLNPADGESYYLSGVVMQRWQKHDQAYANYKTASEKSPTELAYVLAEAESLVTLERQAEALDLLQSKCDYFEHSGVVRDAIGQLLMQKGKFAEAARNFRQAAILSEDEPSIRERLALALFKGGEYREAAEVLTKLVSLPAFAKRADLFVMLGDCQLNSNRARDARFSFETATQLDATSATAWRGLGQAAMAGGDDQRAELALKKSLGCDDHLSETHLLMGYVYTRQNKNRDALASFSKACRLDPSDTVALCMVGFTYEKLGRKDLANRCYSRALKIKPTDEMARKLMAGLDMAP